MESRPAAIMLSSTNVTRREPWSKTAVSGGCSGTGTCCVLTRARSGCIGGSGSRTYAVSGPSVLAPVNRYEATAVRSHTSVSTVTYEGVHIFSGTNIGGAVATSALASEVLHKREEEMSVPKTSPTGMHSIYSNTVVNAGAMSGWYRIYPKVALISPLYSKMSQSGYHCWHKYNSCLRYLTGTR
jgi:hypothetical protein